MAVSSISIYLFVFLMAWFQCWMAAFKPCKLLILQSSLSLVKVFCLYYQACVISIFVYISCIN